MQTHNQNILAEWQSAEATHETPGVGRGIVYFYGAIAFLVGMLHNFVVSMVGMMPVGELLLAMILAHAALWVALTGRLPAPIPSPRLLGFLVACQLVAFASYIFADLWRESSSVDMLRGWLRMVFILIDIGGIALLFGVGDSSFLMMMLGGGFSGLQALILPPLFNEYWKFGFGYPVTILTLFVVSRYFGLWAPIFASLALGALHALMGFRSMGATCIGLGLINVLFLIPRQIRKMIVIAAALMALITAPWTTTKMFAQTADQTNRSNVERAAMLQTAWEAFLESPLIGHGSWFSNTNVMDNFLLIRSEKAAEAGGATGFADDNAEGIAIHSQILDTLAEGGFFGAMFFIGFAVFILWGFWFCLVESPWTPLTPMRIFILFNSFWDVWMSPFSGTVRVSIGTTAALILVLWAERKNPRAAQREDGETMRDAGDYPLMGATEKPAGAQGAL